MRHPHASVALQRALLLVAIVTAACGSSPAGPPSETDGQRSGGGISGGGASSGAAGGTMGAGGRSVASAAAVCDGSSKIRLAVAYDGGIGRQFPFSGVLWELGGYYIYVDGHCTYWTHEWADGALLQWQRIRTGTLTSDEALAFAASVSFGDPSGVSAKCNAGTELNDATIVHIFNGEQAVSCFPDPQLWPDAFSTWQAIGASLYARGSDVPILGARVVSAPRPDGLEGIPAMAWPLLDPVPSFQVPEADEFSPGVSHLVGKSDAEALFVLHDKYVVEEASLLPMDEGIPIEGGYIMFMREELPFTNAAGLVELP